MSWKSLFLPAIQLANEGFRVTTELAYRLKVINTFLNSKIEVSNSNS